MVTKDELELALAEQGDTGRLLGAILVQRGYVSGPALAVALAEQYGVELKTRRGFGTGLWAEIDRRHRQGRGRPEDLGRDRPASPPGAGAARGLASALRADPGALPLLERDGAPPERGDELELPGVSGRLVVAKIGRAPFPGEQRPCAFLLPSD